MTGVVRKTAAFETLDWDSDFFGIKIGRVRVPVAARLPEAVEQADRAGLECLYWLAGSDDSDAPSAAARCGFRLVDIRVTFECDLLRHSGTPNPDGLVIRPFEPAHLPQLLPIAAASHSDSRFFQDGRFPPEKCASLYEAWIRTAAEDPGRHIAIAQMHGRVAGYCISEFKVLPPKISLIAVESFLRRSGVGSALVLAALTEFAERGASSATVATQGRNVTSQRLYQRCGFVTKTVELWFHRWRSEAVSLPYHTCGLT